MTKKLTRLEDLAQIKFTHLAPDPDPLPDSTPVQNPQYLEAHFSNKGRGGKTVTIIKGFEGNTEELKLLTKTLQKAVGVGGSCKDGEIIIQGNFRDQITALLIEMGHTVKRIGG